MGLVTQDLAEWLTPTNAVPEENPFGSRLAATSREPLHTRWQHAVRRLRKWLRTTLAPHGEHGDGLTR